MEWLADEHVDVLPLATLVRLDRSDPRQAVALTFDDGFANFESDALPHLQAHGLPATLFAVTGHVGASNEWAGVRAPGVPSLPLMDWDALERVHEAGVEIGAHTALHPRLTALNDRALAQELAAPIDMFEDRMGLRPTAFAYPYGDVDDRVRERARTLYELGVTTRLDTLAEREDPLGLPRLDMYYFRDRGRLERWGTHRFAAYLKSRQALRRIKSAVTGRAP